MTIRLSPIIQPISMAVVAAGPVTLLDVLFLRAYSSLAVVQIRDDNREDKKTISD